MRAVLLGAVAVGALIAMVIIGVASILEGIS